MDPSLVPAANLLLEADGPGKPGKTQVPGEETSPQERPAKAGRTEKKRGASDKKTLSTAANLCPGLAVSGPAGPEFTAAERRIRQPEEPGGAVPAGREGLRPLPVAAGGRFGAKLAARGSGLAQEGFFLSKEAHRGEVTHTQASMLSAETVKGAAAAAESIPSTPQVHGEAHNVKTVDPLQFSAALTSAATDKDHLLPDRAPFAGPAPEKAPVALARDREQGGGVVPAGREGVMPLPGGTGGGRVGASPATGGSGLGAAGAAHTAGGQRAQFTKAKARAVSYGLIKETGSPESIPFSRQIQGESKALNSESALRSVASMRSAVRGKGPAPQDGPGSAGPAPEKAPVAPARDREQGGGVVPAGREGVMPLPGGDSRVEANPAAGGIGPGREGLALGKAGQRGEVKQAREPVLSTDEVKGTAAAGESFPPCPQDQDESHPRAVRMEVPIRSQERPPSGDGRGIIFDDKGQVLAAAADDMPRPASTGSDPAPKAAPVPFGREGINPISQKDVKGRSLAGEPSVEARPFFEFDQAFAMAGPVARNEGGLASGGLEATAPPLPAETVLRLAEQVQPLAGQGGGRILLSLSPPSLGSLDIEVRVKEERVELYVVAASQEVQRVLYGQAEQLRRALAEQGLNMERFHVVVGDQAAFQGGGEFGQGTMQGRRQESGEAPISLPGQAERDGQGGQKALPSSLSPSSGLINLFI